MQYYVRHCDAMLYGMVQYRNVHCTSVHCTSILVQSCALQLLWCWITVLVAPPVATTARAGIINIRWHHREHATSAPAELGGKIHKVSRNRARAQVPPQARKLPVCGSGTFGAFGSVKSHCPVSDLISIRG